MLAYGSRSWRWITSLGGQRRTTYQGVRDAVVNTTSLKDRCRSSSWVTASIKSGQIADRDKPGRCHVCSPQCVARSHDSERSSFLEKLTRPPSKVRALLLARRREFWTLWRRDNNTSDTVSRSKVHRVHEEKKRLQSFTARATGSREKHIHLKEVVKISGVIVVILAAHCEVLVPKCRFCSCHDFTHNESLNGVRNRAYGAQQIL